MPTRSIRSLDQAFAKLKGHSVALSELARPPSATCQLATGQSDRCVAHASLSSFGPGHSKLCAALGPPVARAAPSQAEELPRSSYSNRMASSRAMRLREARVTAEIERCLARDSSNASPAAPARPSAAAEGSDSNRPVGWPWSSGARVPAASPVARRLSGWRAGRARPSFAFSDGAEPSSACTPIARALSEELRVENGHDRAHPGWS